MVSNLLELIDRIVLISASSLSSGSMSSFKFSVIYFCYTGENGAAPNFSLASPSELAVNFYFFN